MVIRLSFPLPTLHTAHIPYLYALMLYKRWVGGRFFLAFYMCMCMYMCLALHCHPLDHFTGDTSQAQHSTAHQSSSKVPPRD